MRTNLTLCAAAISAAIALPTQANVLISEYVEGSSNNKAIEIVNLGDTAVDLSQYQIKFFMNGASTAGNTIQLAGSLASKATYVVVNGSAVAELKDKGNQVGAGTWYNGDDAVALTQGDTLIDVIGQIGVDPGTAWTGNGVTTLDKTLRRKTTITAGDADGSDAFDPSVQFDMFDKDTFSDIGLYNGAAGGGDTPTPEPEYVHGNCGDATTLISAVQGSTDKSPLVGQKVTIQGVVTLASQGDDGLKGFYMQEEAADADADAQTSEGIFVYDNGFGVALSNGQAVRVSGVVAESFGQTQLGNLIAVSDCGKGETIAAVEISLPMKDANEFEAVEGMRVTTKQTLTVTDNYGLGRYNELVLASARLYNPTQIAKPGDEAKAVMAANALNRLTLDDASNVQNKDSVYPAPGLSADNSLRVGDQVSNIDAVMGYGFSKYRLQPIGQPTFIASNARTAAPEFTVEGDFKIASFNVLNYFNGDGLGGGYPTSRGASTAAEFAKQRAKIISAISAIDADIYGLLEMENDGFGEHSAIADLVAGLNTKAGADVWAFVNFNAEQVGTDAIMSAMIYRKDRVTEAGTAALTTEVPFDYGNRALISQGFTHQVSGDQLNFVVAHLRSKGSCPKDKTDLANIDSGDGAGCWNGVRTEAVAKMQEWLATKPTTVVTDNTVIVGDFNAYLMEDPIAALAKDNMTELSEHFHGSKVHSYVFSGESGSLDHAFASDALLPRIAGVTEWHINADEPIILDYNEEFKSDVAKAAFYAENPFRSSDHDPMVISVRHSLPTINAEQEFSVAEQSAAGSEIGTLTFNSAVTVASFALSGDDAANFAIDAQGKITVAAGSNFDFETKAQYQFNVVLHTTTELASESVAVTVKVTDIAELPTVSFIDAVTSVTEFAEVGTVIAKINAAATSNNGSIAKLTVTKGGDYVAIEGSQLVLKAGLDFESFQSLDIEVTAVDQLGNSNTAGITLAITDEDESSGSTGIFAALGLMLLALRRRLAK